MSRVLLTGAGDNSQGKSSSHHMCLSSLSVSSFNLVVKPSAAPLLLGFSCFLSQRKLCSLIQQLLVFVWGGCVPERTAGSRLGCLLVSWVDKINAVIEDRRVGRPVRLHVGTLVWSLRLKLCYDCVSLQIQTFCGAKS